MCEHDPKYACGLCKRCYDKEQYVKHRAARLEAARTARLSYTPEQKARRGENARRYRESHREATRVSNRASMKRKLEKEPDYMRLRAKAHRDKKRAILHKTKAQPCADCGVQYPPKAMDFHHRDPATKLFTPAALVNKSFEELHAELDKCDVLCSNCHRLRHD